MLRRQQRLAKGDLAVMARGHGIEPHTLRQWEREAQAAELGILRPPPGRPRRPATEREAARAPVRAQLQAQGWTSGERKVFQALARKVPLRLVRELVHEEKAAHRRRRALRCAAHRVSTRVHARDALWSQDATHLGHDAGGQEIQAEVVREVATTRTLSIRVGPPAGAADVVLGLEALRRRRGLPLVLATDNGPAYRSQLVAQYLARHRVVHLFSLPHTPQHNPWAEHGMRDLKDELAIGHHRREPIDPTCALQALLAARERLDTRRPRPTRGGRTAVQADRELPRAPALAPRHSFFENTRCATERAVLSSCSDRGRRRATREAILQCMQRFGLITRTRGGALIPCATSYEVS